MLWGVSLLQHWFVKALGCLASATPGKTFGLAWSRLQMGESTIMRIKLTLALVLAVTTVAISIPASANQKPAKPRNQTSTTVAESRELPAPASAQTAPYSPGYQDVASNKNGW
jgi:hypothetical protein